MSEQDPGMDGPNERGRLQDRPTAAPIPRDEWVAEVVGDPARPQPVQLLSGYVGDAAEPGQTRIYLDPSLASYVDVRDDDVLRFEPLEGDHQPPGGVMVWLRARQPAASGGDFFAGPVMEQHMGAARGVPGVGPVHITLLTVPGCFPPRTFSPLQCFPNPHTRIPILCSWVCQDPLGGFGPGNLHPQQHALMGPAVGPTGYLGCTQMMGCPNTSTCTPQTLGLGCPSTSTCPPHGGPVGVTGWLGCTQMMGCPNTSTCTPHTHEPGCPRTSTCPPGGMLGAALPRTVETVCTQIGCHTHAPGCPSSSTCPPQGGPIGVTGWLGCTQMMGCPSTSTCTPGTVHQQTMATVCTQIGCHTHALGCPSSSTCPPQPATIGVTGWLGCTQLFGCPGTSTCPPGGGTSTMATVCTQLGCAPTVPPPSMICATNIGC